MKLFRGHLFGLREKSDQTGIKIARAGAHRQSCGWRERHTCVYGLAVAHRGETRAIAEMSEDDTSVHARLRHPVFVRQTVKAVAVHTFRFITERDRQPICHESDRAVKPQV